MTNGLHADDGKQWFGVAPPDLSLIARSKGPDYVYTFLKSFYADPAKGTGVNNLSLPGTAMPHVLWELQGTQEAVWEGHTDAQGNVQKHFKEFKLASPGKLTPEEIEERRERLRKLREEREARRSARTTPEGLNPVIGPRPPGASPRTIKRDAVPVDEGKEEE